LQNSFLQQFTGLLGRRFEKGSEGKQLKPKSTKNPIGTVLWLEKNISF
jgi:hypothetical protein